MAATLSVSITGSTVVSGTIQSSISDAHIGDLLRWGSVAFNPYLQATFNASGSSTFVVSSAFVPTNPQVAKAWVQNWWSGTADAVTKFNRDNAVATVVSSGITIIST